MQTAPHRRWAGGALFASLVLHVAFFGWLVRAAERPRGSAARANAAVELTIEETPRAPKRATPPQAKPASDKPGNRKSASRSPAASASLPAPSSPAAQAEGSFVVAPGPVRDVPRKLDLTLREKFDPGVASGETIHDVPGEGDRVAPHPNLQARIDDWLQEGDSLRRVESGLIDDWFAVLGRSLEVALAHSPPPNPWLGNFAGDSEHTPAIWAVVDLQYAPDGKLSTSKLLKSSGDDAFNTHVLKVVAIGLPGLPALPDQGMGIHANGTHSVWEVSGHPTFERDARDLKLKDDWWYLPIAALATVASSPKFDETTGSVGVVDLRHPHVKCAAKLLRVY